EMRSRLAPHFAIGAGRKNPGWIAVMSRMRFVGAAEYAVFARQSYEDPSISSPVPHHSCATNTLSIPSFSERTIGSNIHCCSRFGVSSMGRRFACPRSLGPLNTVGAQVHVNNRPILAVMPRNARSRQPTSADD